MLHLFTLVITIMTYSQHIHQLLFYKITKKKHKRTSHKYIRKKIKLKGIRAEISCFKCVLRKENYELVFFFFSFTFLILYHIIFAFFSTTLWRTSQEIMLFKMNNNNVSKINAFQMSKRMINFSKWIIVCWAKFN